MKKKHFLQQNKFFVIAWIVFHLVLIGSFVVSMMAGRSLNIDSDLFNMLPASTLGKAMGKADERLTESTGQSVYILVSHKDFEKARETAELVYSGLEGDPMFKNLFLYSEETELSAMEEFIHKNRWLLLDDNAVENLSTEDGALDFVDNATAKAFGFFTLTSLENLETDPFLLDEYEMENYLGSIQKAGSSMTAKDGVLAAQKNDLWYVMIRGTLSKEGAALASSKNGITAIYDVCNPLEKDGIRFVYSGTPFHSHKSSTNAMHEISLISEISLGAVFILLLVIFRTPLPLVASIASIFISIATAFAATHTIFGKIHILTLVLGTSLIGSCIDYSLHFFINWKGNTELHSGQEVRKHLFKGLLLSLASTEICYLMLLFAPFNLLKQMGTFSTIGIFSTFLTTVCIYPLLKMPNEKNRKIPLLKYFHETPIRKFKYGTLICTLVLFAITGGIILFHHKDLRIQNDLNKLYSMEGRLKSDTLEVAEVTNYNPSSWFIISGETEEDVLQTEEYVCRELDILGKDNPAGGYLATSSFIPSQAKQKRSLEAAQNLFPFLSEQLDTLGLEPECEQLVKKEYEDAKNNLMLPSVELPDSIESLISSLWLGEIDGKYYSIVMPVLVLDDVAYNRIAAGNDNVYYEDKMKDLGLGLDNVTRLILILFLVAYILILVVLKISYKWSHTFRIASIPLLSVATIIAGFLISKQSIEFFCITGMILVFGLGLDYVIYLIENMKKKESANEESDLHKLEPFAILISFITTAVSFGALAFSTFVPVHAIGLSIFLGLVAAFVGTLI